MTHHLPSRPARPSGRPGAGFRRPGGGPQRGRPGDFTSRDDLDVKITAFAIRHNKNACPYRWSYDAGTVCPSPAPRITAAVLADAGDDDDLAVREQVDRRKAARLAKVRPLLHPAHQARSTAPRTTMYGGSGCW